MLYRDQPQLYANHHADESYRRAIEADPTDALTHYNRALLMQDLDRWPDAVASYDRAIAINPQFAGADTTYSIDHADPVMERSFGVCWDRVAPGAWTPADED